MVTPLELTFGLVRVRVRVRIWIKVGFGFYAETAPRERAEAMSSVSSGIGFIAPAVINLGTGSRLLNFTCTGLNIISLNRSLTY